FPGIAWRRARCHNDRVRSLCRRCRPNSNHFHPMSRFANLEFGNEPEGAPRRHSAGRDEQRCLDDAQAAFEQADFEAALRAFAKVLEFNPHNSVAWAGQVRALVELGEFNEAKLWADKA